MDEAVNVVIIAAAIAILLLTGTLFFDTLQKSDQESTTRVAALLEPGEYTTISDVSGTEETVYETTGYAVDLKGQSDSYIESKAAFDISTDQTWTISAWGYVDSSASGDERTLASINGRAMITYDGAESQWEGWYYDEGSRNSYQVNVSTSGNEVGRFTNIQLWSNGTHLSIYRNNTQGEIENLSTEKITDAPVSSSNWDGRLEELRTFDQALSSSVRQELVDSPTEEKNTVSPTSRAMFDQPNRDTQVLLYTDTKLEQSNVGFDPGFPEDIQQKSGDYNWREDGPQIQPQSGGDLDGAPVAYVSYSANSRGTNFAVGAWTELVALVMVIPILAMAIVILNRLDF